MIFVVENKEGSGVQAEDQDDSGSTQQATWDPGFWEQLGNTGTLPHGGLTESGGFELLQATNRRTRADVP